MNSLKTKDLRDERDWRRKNSPRIQAAYNAGMLELRRNRPPLDCAKCRSCGAPIEDTEHMDNDGMCEGCIELEMSGEGA